MSKYNARRVRKDGYTFDSKAEARRYDVLKLLEQACELSNLEVHPKFLLQSGFTYKGKRYRPIYYIGDFAYLENGGHVVEDVKGARTRVFMLKMKLFLKKYPDIDFRIVEA